VSVRDAEASGRSLESVPPRCPSYKGRLADGHERQSAKERQRCCFVFEDRTCNDHAHEPEPCWKADKERQYLQRTWEQLPRGAQRLHNEGTHVMPNAPAQCPLLGVLYRGIAGVQRETGRPETAVFRGFGKAAAEGISSVAR
jgi:hypothetical protein